MNDKLIRFPAHSERFNAKLSFLGKGEVIKGMHAREDFPNFLNN